MELLRDMGVLSINPITNLKMNKSRRFGEFYCTYCNNIVVLRKDAGTKAKSCKACSNIVQAESNTTHGESKSRLYYTYIGMLRRCYTETDESYKYYGAKGATVCAEWKESYETFRDWALANGYEEHLVLDKDAKQANTANKIYSPDTCVFIHKTSNASIKSSRNTSGYIGVSFHTESKKYTAVVAFNRVQNYLGLFDTALEAAITRDTYILDNKLEHTLNGVLDERD